MSVTENNKDLSFIPLEEALTPPEGIVYHRVNRWWVVHPTKGLVIWRRFSAQCNSDKRCIEHIRDRLYPWAEIHFMPSVFTREE